MKKQQAQGPYTNLINVFIENREALRTVKKSLDSETFHTFLDRGSLVDKLKESGPGKSASGKSFFGRTTGRGLLSTKTNNNKALLAIASSADSFVQKTKEGGVTTLKENAANELMNTVMTEIHKDRDTLKTQADLMNSINPGLYAKPLKALGSVKSHIVDAQATVAAAVRAAAAAAAAKQEDETLEGVVSMFTQAEAAAGADSDSDSDSDLAPEAAKAPAAQAAAGADSDSDLAPEAAAKPVPAGGLTAALAAAAAGKPSSSSTRTPSQLDIAGRGSAPTVTTPPPKK
jgi:hypothetical protein